jgi:hypothetical protein
LKIDFQNARTMPFSFESEDVARWSIFDGRFGNQLKWSDAYHYTGAIGTSWRTFLRTGAVPEERELTGQN